MAMDDFGHGFGLRPDAPDRRDRALYQALVNIDALPEKASCEGVLPPVMDQNAVGACVGYSAAHVMFAIMKKDKHRKPFVPSPVFLYREARVLGGYVEEDAGAEIRLAWKAAFKLGMPPMSTLKPRFNAGDLPDGQTWLFPEKSIWRRAPSASIYKDAETRQAIQYFKCFNLGDMLKSIAEGWPVQFGFTVFRSLYGPSGPLFNAPDPRPEAGDRELGGHAVTAYAYDRPSRRLFLRNQWGSTAHEGKPNFTLSFEAADRWSSDCWTGRLIEGGVLVPATPG